MRYEYAPSLRPREASALRCGRPDCCYCAPRTDTCDYLLIEGSRRGCPPTPDCPRYTPAGRLRLAPSDALAARIQAYADMGMNTRQIARRLRVCEPALRRLRARAARGGR